MDFYFQSNSAMNSLKCPKSKSLSHCLTKLFLFYQNKHWTIQRRNNGSVDQPFHRILSKIVRFLTKNEKSFHWKVEPWSFITIVFTVTPNLKVVVHNKKIDMEEKPGRKSSSVAIRIQDCQMLIVKR